VLFIGHAMKIVKIIILSAIVALVVAFMKIELRHLMHEGFWPGLVAVLICVGMIVVTMALTARARKRLKTETAAQAGRAPRRSRSENFSHSKIGKLLAAYPGPITLTPSRLKWVGWDGAERRNDCRVHLYLRHCIFKSAGWQ